MSKDLYLGVDMGGTQIKVAVVTSKGVIKEETAMPTDVNAKPSNEKKTFIFAVMKGKKYKQMAKKIASFAEKIILPYIKNSRAVNPIDLKNEFSKHISNVLNSVVYLASKLKNYPKTKSIGVGIAGDIDSKKGVVRFSRNLPKWKNIQLKKILEKLTKKRTFVDNDANTASLGAFWLDAKGKADNLICINYEFFQP